MMPLEPLSVLFAIAVTAILALAIADHSYQDELDDLEDTNLEPIPLRRNP